MAWTTWEETKVSFDIKPNGSRAMREGRFVWSEMADMIAEIFPVPVVTGAVQTDGQGIALPGFGYLRADSIHIEPEVPEKTTNVTGLTSFLSLNTYAYGIAQVSYVTAPTLTNSGGSLPESQPFNPDPVQLLEHRWSIGAEFLTIKPPTTWNWYTNSDDPVPDDLPLGKLVPTIEHQITWPSVLFPPFTAMRSCVGKINSATMTLQTGAIRRSTLLFLGAELSRQVLSDGTRAWQVTYRFSERLIAIPSNAIAGWNVLWNPTSYEFDVLENAAGTDDEFPYEHANFNGLFVPEVIGT